MADKRINALANTAPSTASDDFIAVDGTTNGTRKLSAFSPTFGGNATVTGTLTVNSTSTLTGATVIGGDSSNGNYLSYNTDISGFCGLWMRQSTKSATNYVLASNGTSGTLVNSTGASLFLRVENTTALEINTSRNVLIPTTTASTTTSSGALVVSGGLGVAGNINGGGAILAQGALSSIPAVNYLSTELSSGQGYITCYNGSGSAYLALNYRASQHNFTSNGAVAVQSTTASTSTSSGALVVSGGVGVAGAIYLGGILVSSGSSGGLAAESRDGSGYRTTWYNPTGDDMQLDFAGIGTKFTITSAGDTTIAGKITTSAPTGGAGAWELGTYSSTAPSATGYVTIEIGGTVYKLLASNV